MKEVFHYVLRKTKLGYNSSTITNLKHKVQVTI